MAQKNPNEIGVVEITTDTKKGPVAHCGECGRGIYKGDKPRLRYGRNMALELTCEDAVECFEASR